MSSAPRPNVKDVTQAGALLHGEEQVAFADAGYQACKGGPQPRGPAWHVAMRPGKVSNSIGARAWQVIAGEIEKLKASVDTKVEHPFRVLKRQFGFTKVATAAWRRLSADPHAVRTVESVDDATAVCGCERMSARALA